MAKIKITDNSSTDDAVVSPTQNQMDQWVEAELAEAKDDDMLGNNDATTIFKDESTNESID